MGSPRVVLLHGFASTPELTWGASGWTRMLERDGRDWIAPVLAGHGPGSVYSHDPADYRLEVLIEQLMETIGDERVDLVGYSFGGELAVDFSLTYPTRVRRLIVGGIGAERAVPVEMALALRAHAVEATPIFGARERELWDTAQAVPGNDLQALAAFLVGVSASARRNDYERFDGRALVFAGTADSYAHGAAELASHFRRCEFMELPGRTHRTALSSSILKQRVLAAIG